MSDVWSKWFELAKTNDVERIGRALDAVVPLGSPRDAAGIERSCSAIHRSHGLVRLARDWENPTFGFEAADSAKHRGRQWRLVVAYAGWESFVRGVTRQKATWEHRAILPGVLDGPIAAPARNAAVARWLDEVTEPAASEHVAAYFELDKHSAPKVDAWLVKGEPVTTAVDAMTLAAALRHATVHGMLSATKAHEWGLLAGFDALTAHVVGAVEGALSRALG